MRERLLQARENGESSKDINVDDYTRYLVDPCWSIRPGREWFNEGGTQADRPDGA